MIDPHHVITSMTGSDAPDIDCVVCFDIIDQYVDDVVAGADPQATNPRMHTHLQQCPACNDEFTSLREAVTTINQGEPS